MTEFLFKTPILRAGCFFFYQRQRSPFALWLVCKEGLRELFYIPREAEAVQFFAYAQPGKNRVKVERCGGCRAKVAGTKRFFGGNTPAEINRLLSEYGPTVYVECVYW